MHHQPQSDWVAYVVMFFVVIGVLYGKHLMFKGDEPIEQALKEDIKDVEEIVEEIEEKVEEKLK